MGACFTGYFFQELGLHSLELGVVRIVVGVSVAIYNLDLNCFGDNLVLNPKTDKQNTKTDNRTLFVF